MKAKKAKAPTKASKKTRAPDPPMKKKKKPLPHRFKKGEPSMNPDGGRKHDHVMKRIKLLTRQELATVCNLVLQGNIEQLEEICEDREYSSALKVLVASIVKRGVRDGNFGAFDALLNRLLGKVPDRMDLNHLNSGGPTIVVTLPSNGREILQLNKPPAALPEPK